MQGRRWRAVKQARSPGTAELHRWTGNAHPAAHRFLEDGDHRLPLRRLLQPDVLHHGLVGGQGAVATAGGQGAFNSLLAAAVCTWRTAKQRAVV